jgi:menaquinol-cytochrome c reductase iron-sulfur subunit
VNFYDDAMNATQGDNIRSLDEPERRSFLARTLAILVGSIVAIFPFAAGFGVLLHPLRRRHTDGDNQSDAAEFIRVCPLSALPPDGTPHSFVVTTDVTDAWTRAQSQRVGSVFLSRSDADGKPQVTAFTSACPHLGCAVEFDSGQDRFECPCHESGFGKDGEKLFGPSLRGLDPLEVKLTGEEGAQEVLVAFRRFRAGVAERIPVG